MDVSRCVSGYFSKKNKNDCMISLDIAPDLSEDEIYERLHCIVRHNGQLLIDDLLFGFVPKKLGALVCRSTVKYAHDSVVSRLREEDLRAISRKMKKLSLKARGTKDFSNAQVTAGGINISEIDPYSLESRLVKGLYFSGEIIDIDARCGGFNLEWAWNSGRLAGISAAKALKEEKK